MTQKQKPTVYRRKAFRKSGKIEDLSLGFGVRIPISPPEQHQTKLKACKT
jgi:hypothetical protein